MRERNIIEGYFYDKQHGINSDYPCMNTCISDNEGEDCFTKTYFSYYKAETPQNAEYVYIRECEFL